MTAKFEIRRLQPPVMVDNMTTVPHNEVTITSRIPTARRGLAMAVYCCNNSRKECLLPDLAQQFRICTAHASNQVAYLIIKESKEPFRVRPREHFVSRRCE